MVQPELTFLAALIVGFLGSTHCIGMCSGIAGTLAVSGPAGNRAFIERSVYLSLYNLGRIISYTIAGYAAATLGYLGMGMFPVNIAHAVAAAISILFVAALGAHLAGWWSFLPMLERLGARLWRRIEPWGRRLLPVKNKLHAFSFGLVWGWLPCGLVYSVLAWAAATGDPRRGALLMLGFGLGTLPTVLCLGAAGQTLQRLRSRPGIRQAAGISLMMFAAALFMLYQFNGHAHGSAHSTHAGVDNAAHKHLANF